MKVTFELSDQDLEYLDVIGVSTDNFSQPLIKLVGKAFYDLLAIRHDAAVSGAMRWSNSQEYPLKIRLDIIDH